VHDALAKSLVFGWSSAIACEDKPENIATAKIQRLIHPSSQTRKAMRWSGFGSPKGTAVSASLTNEQRLKIGQPA
jgi:hypothetical protein